MFQDQWANPSARQPAGAGERERDLAIRFAEQALAVADHQREDEQIQPVEQAVPQRPRREGVPCSNRCRRSEETHDLRTEGRLELLQQTTIATVRGGE
jgi:hypothetical protein